MEISPGKSFVWKGADQSLSFIPVRYEQFDAETGLYMHMRCGVFVVPSSGPAAFLPSFNDSFNDLLQCSELKAIRFEDDAVNKTAPPRLVLLYGIDSPNASSVDIVIFDWSAKKKEYARNETLAKRLGADSKAVGIGGIERQLKSYKPR